MLQTLRALPVVCHSIFLPPSQLLCDSANLTAKSCKVVKSSPHHGSASLRHPIEPGKNEQNHALSVTAIPLLIWQGHVSHFHPPIIMDFRTSHVEHCRSVAEATRLRSSPLVPNHRGHTKPCCCPSPVC
jgi:hypothetical protein